MIKVDILSLQGRKMDIFNKWCKENWIIWGKQNEK